MKNKTKTKTLCMWVEVWLEIPLKRMRAPITNNLTAVHNGDGIKILLGLPSLCWNYYFGKYSSRIVNSIPVYCNTNCHKEML